MFDAGEERSWEDTADLSDAIRSILETQRQERAAERTANEGHRIHEAAEIAFARTLIPMVTTAAWNHDACRSFAQWLTLQYGMDRRDARRWQARAELLAGSPAANSHLDDHSIDLPLLDVLARHQAGAPADVALATTLDPKALDDELTRRRKSDEPDDDGPTVEDANAAHDKRNCTNKPVPGFGPGMRRLILDLPTDTFATVWGAANALAHRIGPNTENGIYDTPGHLLADAFVLLAQAAVTDDAKPAPATCVVHMDQTTRRAIIDGAEICNQTWQRLCCDGRLEVVLHDDQTGQPITVSDQQRNATASQRRALKHSDGPCCTFPGCTATWFLIPHHIWHWEHGGPTELWNLVLVCTLHHRAVHEGGYKVAKARDGTITWHRPTGQRVHGYAASWTAA